MHPRVKTLHVFFNFGLRWFLPSILDGAVIASSSRHSKLWQQPPGKYQVGDHEQQKCHDASHAVLPSMQGQ